VVPLFFVHPKSRTSGGVIAFSLYKMGRGSPLAIDSFCLTPPSPFLLYQAASPDGEDDRFFCLDTIAFSEVELQGAVLFSRRWRRILFFQARYGALSPFSLQVRSRSSPQRFRDWKAHIHAKANNWISFPLSCRQASGYRFFRADVSSCANRHTPSFSRFN